MGLEDRIPSRGQVACPAGIQVPGLPGTQKSLEGPLPRSQARYGIRPPMLYQEKERRKPYPRVATWLRTHWEAAESRATGEGNAALLVPGPCGPLSCSVS